MKKSKSKTGIDISFEGLSFGKKLSIWWSFTLACFFNQKTLTKYPVTEILIEGYTFKSVK
jgi:hypothetical protein